MTQPVWVKALHPAISDGDTVFPPRALLEFPNAIVTDVPLEDKIIIEITGGGAVGGDLSGTVTSATVAKVKGTAIGTAGGALAVGKVLRVTGSSSADWGAVDLADTDAVTGVLPTSNQAAQAMGGDVSGTTASATVVALQGFDLDSATPSTNDVLTWDGSQWTPAPSSGSGITQLTGDVLAGPASGSVASTVAALSGAAGTLPIADTGASVTWAETVIDPILTVEDMTTDDLPQDVVIKGQKPFASSTGANQQPGRVVARFNTAAGGAAHSGGFAVEINTTPIVAMGEYGSSGSSYGAMWFASNAITPGTSNWAFLGSVSDTYFNAPSSTIYFGIAGAYYMTITTAYLAMGITYSAPNVIIDFSDTTIIHFAARDTTAKIMVDTKTSDAAPIDLVLQAQAPYATATGANRKPGSTVINVPAKIGSPGHFGGFEIRYDGTQIVTIGEYSDSGTTYGGVWLGSAAITPSTSNYAVLGGSGGTYINASSDIYIGVASTITMHVTASVLQVGPVFTTPFWIFDYSTSSALLRFGVDGTNCKIIVDTSTSGDGRDIVLEAGDCAGGGNERGGHAKVRGGAQNGTGVVGGVTLEINGTPEVMLQVGEVITGQRLIALLFGDLLTTTQMPSGTGDMVIFVTECVTPPTVSPSGGGIAYVEGGALKWRAPSDTVTTMGFGEPHCSRCGSDFALEYVNERYGGRFAVCVRCMVRALDAYGVSASDFMICSEAA